MRRRRRMYRRQSGGSLGAFFAIIAILAVFGFINELPNAQLIAIATIIVSIVVAIVFIIARRNRHHNHQDVSELTGNKLEHKPDVTITVDQGEGATNKLDNRTLSSGGSFYDTPSGELLDDLNIRGDLHFMWLFLDDVNTSNNIDTVMGAYERLLKTLTKLATHESNPSLSFGKELPSQALTRIQNEKTEIMNRAVERSYDTMILGAMHLKTEKGRANRRLKFFENLEQYEPRLSDETKKFIQDLWWENDADVSTAREMRRLSNRAFDDFCEQARSTGAEMYRIITAGDNRVCEACRSFDLCVLPVKKANVGDSVPPFHAHCRCTVVFEI